MPDFESDQPNKGLTPEEIEEVRRPRPLEGLSGAHTTWTGEQDDEAAAQIHSHDEDRSPK